MTQQNSTIEDIEQRPWIRVSPSYVKIILINRAIFLLVIMSVAGLVWMFREDEFFSSGLKLPIILGVLGVLFLGQLTYLLLAPRYVKSIGYHLDERHLVITRGILMRKVISVPYGRLQYVDVTSGLVSGIFKLASLELHTASVGTEAKIPGLPQPEAEKIREILTQDGVEQMVK
ncbi:PH domain-containing protein [Rothia sp. CCM 9418]|uniref:PH domain-containing protein n=1 Tax=Rothia sp. CCM 9418 TaxID=3402661 RepID=UPI003ADBEDD1